MSNDGKLQITLNQNEVEAILESLNECRNILGGYTHSVLRTNLFSICWTLECKLDKAKREKTISENNDNAAENDHGYPDY